VATLTRGPTRITGARLPILSWAPDLEPGALVQARNCADLPAAFHHVAVMADGHEGYGVPIGAVLALRDAVSPYAVGNDIGCGMALVATRLTRDDLLGPVPTRSGSRGPVARDEIMGWVQSSIPAGPGSHRHAGADAAAEPLVEQTFAALEAASEACGIALSTSQSTRRGGGQRLTRAQLTARARDQLGTLGSGNHFIELLAGPDGDVWVLVHSGSRGLGGMVCANFHRMALDYCAAGGHRLADPGLAWLPMAGDDSWATVGHCYRAAMEAALEYAQLNRHRMLEAVAVIIERRFPGAMRWNETINIHHNDAAEEHHYGERVWVHRKGAVKAMADTPTITPGSMGTGSVLGRGLGNPASYCSAAHGAGRALSRSRARRELLLDQQLAAVAAAGGKVFAASKPGVLDEMPGAYKDLDDVMAHQADLVEPVRRFTPLATYKGTDKPRRRQSRWPPAEER
jgi:tRNA-splicing ligase RtcB